MAYSWLPDFKKIPADEIARKVLGWLLERMWALLVMAFSYLAALWMTNDPVLASKATRWDVVVATIIIALAVSVVWVAVPWGLVGLKKLLRGDDAQPAPPSALPSQQQPENHLPPSGDPVEFVIKGQWLNTPFRCSLMGANDNKEPLFAEELYITVVAREYLENVRFSVAVKAPSSMDDIREYHHHGDTFEGTVTPGMETTVRVFRRVFRLANGAIRLADGSSDHLAKFRRDVSAVFFDGTSRELSVGIEDRHSIEVRVNHRRGSVVARFVLDCLTIPSPRSRVVIGNGPIRTDIRNNFVNPVGFPEGDPNLL